MIPFTAIKSAVFDRETVDGFLFKIGLLSVVLSDDDLLGWNVGDGPWNPWRDWGEGDPLVPGETYTIEVRRRWAKSHGFAE